MAAASMILPIVQKLGSLQMDQTNYLFLAKPEVDSLCKQLREMIAYLMGEEAIYPNDPVVKVGVRQFRELVFEAEDAFDLFAYEEALRQQENVVMKIVMFPKFLCMTHKLIGKIRKFTGRIQRLSVHITIFRIQHLKVSQTCANRGSHGFVDVVGLQSEADELAKLLMKEEPNVSFGVVSITGMGGVGCSKNLRQS
ncbi:probable disease resistance RPP8-like protein 2 [Macadamia integrifolia]|uniref:probable disease resistance RPP8-like protein 2 n=1 Tax=Macadamia integrifolia TaxID=60698 RepID=UPI001C4F79EA|nr:probable disease resistance RPP8-like protein 2 [Macadamia integrifolia]